jgi:hypothetical protein
MAGVRAILFPRKPDPGNTATATFISLFINPKTKGYDFIVSDTLFHDYKQKISPAIPERYGPLVDNAFAKAIPLAEVSDRWNLRLALWKLGR